MQAMREFISRNVAKRARPLHRRVAIKSPQARRNIEISLRNNGEASVMMIIKAYFRANVAEHFDQAGNEACNEAMG